MCLESHFLLNCRSIHVDCVTLFADLPLDK